MFTIIAALDEKGVIGRRGKLPWPKIKKDLNHFYNLTKGKPIVMGYTTFLSLGRPLPERENIILTHRSISIPDCRVEHSLRDVIKRSRQISETMIIGGASVYQQFLPLSDKMYLTIIHHQFPGDTFFPHFSIDEWAEIERIDYLADEENIYPFSFLTLVRRKDV